MPQPPKAISLTLCDQVVFELGTQRPSLVGVFNGVAVDSFPTIPQRFDIFASFTGGPGVVKMIMRVEHLETKQEIYAQKLDVRFPDRPQVVNVRLRIRKLIYDE